jgi:hypothetical protein
LKQYAKININQVRMALFLSGDIHEGNRSAVLVFDIELGIETMSWYYKNITNDVSFTQSPFTV